MKYKALETKRQIIVGKIVVGIDPGKTYHQASVLDCLSAQLSTFTFPVNFGGYSKRLWQMLDASVLRGNDFSHLVFAKETSCNLWQTLATTWVVQAISWC